MGFGFTDEDNRLWEQGWPFMIHLGAGVVKDKDVATSAAFWKAHGTSFGEVAAPAASRLLRMSMVPPWGSPADRDAAVQNGADISDEEAARFASDAISAPAGMAIVFLLEAIKGPAWTLNHMIGALEALAPEQWTSSPVETNAGNTFRALHFVMLRGDKDGIARNRLQALAEKAPTDPMNRAAAMLRFILAPKPTQETWRLTYLHDGAPIADILLPQLAKAKPADRFHVDARMIYLGGDRVIEGVAKHIKNLYKGHQETLVEHLSRCSHPAVVDVMKAVNNGPAKKWLKAHLS